MSWWSLTSLTIVSTSVISYWTSAPISIIPPSYKYTVKIVTLCPGLASKLWVSLLIILFLFQKILIVILFTYVQLWNMCFNHYRSYELQRWHTEGRSSHVNFFAFIDPRKGDHTTWTLDALHLPKSKEHHPIIKSVWAASCMTCDWSVSKNIFGIVEPRVDDVINFINK